LQIGRAKPHIGLIRASGDDLFCHPAVRLLQFASRKELHWRAAYSCSSKSKRERLPTWLGDDGYFGDLNAVRKKELQIVSPIRAALPSLKLFKNNQQTRFKSTVDLARDCTLLCPKFGLFQNAT